MRILIVDDHRLMREGLRALLEREGMIVVGEADSGRGVMTAVEELRPDVLIMDVSMPELNGVDATRQVSTTAPWVRVVGLSMNADRRFVVAMFEAGASGYVLKTSAADELVHALQEVSAGRRYLSAKLVEAAPDLLESSVPRKRTPVPSSLGKALTLREREVLQLVAEGNSSKEIAVKLAVAVPTVETHRRQITEKLGLHSIAELTKYAIREGLTSPD
jgi:DNA-binding NarL/FixJ family response regulator